MQAFFGGSLATGYEEKISMQSVLRRGAWKRLSLAFIDPDEAGLYEANVCWVVLSALQSYKVPT